MEREESLLLREDKNGICNLTLNRPKARNALSFELMGLIIAELKTINKNNNLKVVILDAKGPAFCSGHDLKELKSVDDHEFTEKVFQKCSNMMMEIMKLRIPVIAKVHGIATAAGCQLVATCDLAIASNESVFATPGVNIGLFCTTPSVALSRVIPRKKSLEMLLTGENISAETAVKFGLINSIVEKEKLDAEVERLARVITKKPRRVIEIGKKAFYEQLEKPISQSYDYASGIMAKNMLEDDCIEGISAFVEKRKPIWKS
ncbi:MAG: enoyl-CoA hydratase [Rhodospirillaceae bacterium]|nr:enoyl-CoA hydratase [Rhodospirillaceae bacterium]|tara:strand:- start:187 stop:969 length:783 start_codon:yes stop_codon:yes gene_type:complete